MNGIVLGHSPWIPDGTYIVGFTHYETRKSWNGCKVHAHFAVSDGEYAGTPLTRFYNVDALIGQSGKDGRFQVSENRHLVREFRALIPDIESPGTIDLGAYRDKLIRAEVGTVGKDGLGQSLPDDIRYSRIKRLIEIVPDNCIALWSQ